MSEMLNELKKTTKYIWLYFLLGIILTISTYISNKLFWKIILDLMSIISFILFAIGILGIWILKKLRIIPEDIIEDD
jgi:hypothetical protein